MYRLPIFIQPPDWSGHLAQSKAHGLGPPKLLDVECSCLLYRWRIGVRHREQTLDEEFGLTIGVIGTFLKAEQFANAGQATEGEASAASVGSVAWSDSSLVMKGERGADNPTRAR